MSNDRVVVITGASSGIGKCCAEYLVQKKFRIYGTSRKPISTADEITYSSTNLIQMIQMDVYNVYSLKHSVLKLSLDYIVYLYHASLGRSLMTYILQKQSI